VFKIAAVVAMTAIAVSTTASTAEAGARGLMTGLFIGALGAHMIDQSYRAEQRREAYDAARIRRERAIAAERAAQQERAAEYRRIQLENANAEKIAAEDAADDAAEDAADDAGATSAQTATTTTAQDTTAIPVNVTTSSATTPSSTDAADEPTCRKYSPATDGMIDTRCP
jgi:hypothetical protein